MATKIERPVAPAPSPAASSPSDAAAAKELEILHPDRDVTIAGRAITMREYGFVEGLQMRAIAKPFLDELYALVAPNGKAPSFEQVEEMLAVHAECVLELIVRAANVEREWIESLSDEEGYFLMQTWWMVNSGFFIRRVVQRLATERAAARMSQAGRASTTRSSGPDMAARPPISAG